MELQVGQKVYIGYQGTWSTSFNAGEVIKVTPSGMSQVKTFGDVKKFNSAGREVGNTHRGYFIDHLPFDERTASIQQTNRAKLAAAALSKLTFDQRVTGHWSQERMLIELAEFETKVAEARKLVEAI